MVILPRAQVTRYIKRSCSRGSARLGSLILRSTPMRLTAVFLLSLVLAGPAVSATVGGVDVPDTANVADTPLVLNGAGVRVKFFFKIYVGGLYLAAKSPDPAA